MNYKKQIEELLKDNGCKITQTSGRGYDFKAIYIIGLTPCGCYTITGKNYKDILLKVYQKFNKKLKWNL